MITVEDDGARMFLGLVEASIREGRRITCGGRAPPLNQGDVIHPLRL